MLGIDGILNLAGTVLDKFFPDKDEAEKAKLKLLEMQQAGELAYLDAELKTDLAQAEINKVEAANASLFVSGWRPFTGWVCGGSLAYTITFYPIVSAILSYNYPGIKMPEIDIIDLALILTGMLGVNGVSRTFEKRKGVALGALTPKQ